MPDPTGSAGGEPNLSATAYQSICEFLDQNCGIVLGNSKQYLAKSRLLPLLVKFELADFNELAQALQSNAFSAAKLKSTVIDAMTTNETYWFRDDKQFSDFKDRVLPELLSQKNGSLRIWSAACSTGQEPYSLSICALEVLRGTGKNRNIQIIGTDISETVLADAKRAVYSELALSRGVDSATQARYFQKSYEGYTLNDDVRQLVRFQQFNLLKSFAALGRFDVVFCRNVLIYFSDAVKRDIIGRMAENLETGGYLFLSSTESMPTGLNAFEPVRNGQSTYFRKRG